MLLGTRAVLGGIIVAASTLLRAGTGTSDVQPQEQRPVAKAAASSRSAGTGTVFSKPKTADLPNGLHVLVLEDPHVQRVAFQLHMLGAGPYYDPAGSSGLADITAATAIRGTTATPFEKLLDDAKEWDAEFNMVAAGPGSTVTLAGGQVPTRHFADMLNLLADLARNPAFLPEDIEVVRQETRKNIVGWRNFPPAVTEKQLTRALYGQHPGASADPTLSLVDNVTRQQLVEFAKERYVPDHTVLAIAGAVTFDDCMRLVQNAFGSWKRSGRTFPPAVAPAEVVPGLRLVDMNAPVARVEIAALAVNRTSVDFEPLEILTRLLYVPRRPGRLQTALRAVVPADLPAEQSAADAHVNPQRFGGNWRAHVTAKLDSTSSAVDGLLREIARLRDETVDSAELEAAKAAAVSDYVASMEDPHRRLASYLSGWIYQLPPDFWDKRAERLSAITAAQLRAVARRYLDPKRLVIVVVGPRDKLERQLKSFGPVTLLDVDGRVLSQ